VVITEVSAPGRQHCFKLEATGSSCFLQVNSVGAFSYAEKN